MATRFQVATFVWIKELTEYLINKNPFFFSEMVTYGMSSASKGSVLK